MTHEPVAFTIGWLRSQLSPTLAPTVTSMLDQRDAVPAVIVPRQTGGPLADASGVDTVYDWTMTVYVHAGKIGPGKDLPDSQAAHQVAAAIVTACRNNVSSRYSDGDAELVAATVITMTRGVDENGNARATLTLALRVQE